MALKGTTRLQKYLASCGVASRRKSEEMILAGRISVDGIIVREMGTQIIPGSQKICCDNIPVIPDSTQNIYILLNKPKGYVTTLSDPQGRPIVTSLLKNVTTRVFPVGRLDLNTEGALLLTNDGALAHKVLHPKFETNKTYEALVKGIPSSDRINSLKRGIMLEGKKTWPADISLIKQKERSALFKITIHEGRKRQVRKMFEAIGHPIINLKRTAYGQLKLGSLQSGSYRFLDTKELKKIFL